MLKLNMALESESKNNDSLLKIEIDDSQKLNDQKRIADSIQWVDSLLDSYYKNFMTYRTFNGKAKIDIKSSNGDIDSYVAYISLIKDSIIYIVLKANIIGISAIGAQFIINPDSIEIFNRINKSYHKYGRNFLTEKFNIDLDFKNIEELILGTFKFEPKEIKYIFNKGDKKISLHVLKNELEIELTISSTNWQINSLMFNNLTNYNINHITINNSSFANINDQYFSTHRLITFYTSNHKDIEIEFKDYNFNEPLKYQFQFSKNQLKKNINKNKLKK